MDIKPVQIENLEEVLKLMTKYFIDQVKFGDIVITKTQHIQADTTPSKQTMTDDDEELLFYSSK